MKMWFVLVMLAGACCLWFLGKGFWEGYVYVRLNARAPAEVVAWDVEEVNASKYRVRAAYRYCVGERQWEGKTLFADAYLNRPAAEAGIRMEGKKKWMAWYDASDPGYSSLEKRFPWKSGIYAAVTLLVFFYFLSQHFSSKA